MRITYLSKYVLRIIILLCFSALFPSASKAEDTTSSDQSKQSSIYDNLEILKNRSERLYNKKEYQEAEKLQRVILSTYEQLHGTKHPFSVFAMYKLAKTLDKSRQFEEAELIYKKSIKVIEDSQGKDSPYLIGIVHSLGLMLSEQGRFKEAVAFFRRSLEMNDNILEKGHTNIAVNLNSLSYALLKTGALKEAELLLNRACNIWEKKTGRQSIKSATCRSSMAEIYYAIGKYTDAESLYLESIETLENYKNVEKEITISLSGLAILNDTLGRYQRAEKLYRRVLSILENVPQEDSLHSLATTLNNLGGILYRTGKYLEAEDLFRRSLIIKEKMFGSQSPNLTAVLSNLAAIMRDMKRYDEAEPLYRRSVSIVEKNYGYDSPNLALHLNNLASLMYFSGRHSEAEKLYQRAYVIVAIAGRPEITEAVQNNLKNFYQNSHNPDLAIFFGKQSINTIQSVRLGLLPQNGEASVLKSYSKTVSDRYQSFADLLMEHGRLLEAEQVLAMLKEQEYFSFIRRDSRSDVRTTKASYNHFEAPWANRYADISSRFTLLSKEHSNLLMIHKGFRSDEQSNRIIEIEAELARGRSEIEMFLENIKIEFQQLSQNSNQQVIALPNNFPTDTNLGNDSALVHYLVTPERVRILLTTEESQIHRDSHISEPELNRLISDYRVLLETPSSDPLSLAQRLYDVLIRPIEQDLKQVHAKTLMLSLHSTLRYLPMAALHSGKHWLVEDYDLAIYTATTRSNLSELSNLKWHAAGFGVSLGGEIDGRIFSPLPSVPLELDNIILTDNDDVGVIPGQTKMDDDFDVDSLIDAIKTGDYQVLHLATHFHFDPSGIDSDSFLLLGNNQRLTLADFDHDQRLKMDNIDLLTLSACDTAIGVQADGREIEGLGTMAQLQGAKAVLASLWSINDVTTSFFMKTLYESRQLHHFTKAAALREAQLAFIKGNVDLTNMAESQRGLSRAKRDKSKKMDIDELLAHPHYWAPFVLMGNWL